MSEHNTTQGPRIFVNWPWGPEGGTKESVVDTTFVEVAEVPTKPSTFEQDVQGIQDTLHAAVGWPFPCWQEDSQ